MTKNSWNWKTMCPWRSASPRHPLDRRMKFYKSSGICIFFNLSIETLWLDYFATRISDATFWRCGYPYLKWKLKILSAKHMWSFLTARTGVDTPWGFTRGVDLGNVAWHTHSVTNKVFEASGITVNTHWRCIQRFAYITDWSKKTKDDVSLELHVV